MGSRDGKCNRCQGSDGADRYSYGVYAGYLCRKCAIDGFRDHCGLVDGKQGDPSDLDEPVEPEPYYGSQDDYAEWSDLRQDRDTYGEFRSDPPDF